MLSPIISDINKHIKEYRKKFYVNKQLIDGSSTKPFPFIAEMSCFKCISASFSQNETQLFAEKPSASHAVEALHSCLSQDVFSEVAAQP